MTHPLTDEFIRSKFNGTLFDQNELGFEEDEMRAAADWQLEQVVGLLQRNHDPDNKYTLDTVALMLKGAMRPQQLEDN